MQTAQRGLHGSGAVLTRRNLKGKRRVGQTKSVGKSIARGGKGLPGSAGNPAGLFGSHPGFSVVGVEESRGCGLERGQVGTEGPMQRLYLRAVQVLEGFEKEKSLIKFTLWEDCSESRVEDGLGEKDLRQR